RFLRGQGHAAILCRCDRQKSTSSTVRQLPARQAICRECPPWHSAIWQKTLFPDSRNATRGRSLQESDSRTKANGTPCSGEGALVAPVYASDNHFMDREHTPIR